MLDLVSHQWSEIKDERRRLERLEVSLEEKTEMLEKRLLEAAMISAPKLYEDSSDEEAYAVKRSIYGGGKRAGPGESDSDGSDSDY